MTEEEFEVEIIVHLTELDLFPIDHEISEAEVKSKYRSFSRVFHPDGNEYETFRDGEKQKKINGARDFLLQNLDRVNRFIRKRNHIPDAEDEARERARREAAEAAETAREEQARAAREEAAREAREQKAREDEKKRENGWHRVGDKWYSPSEWEAVFGSAGVSSGSSSGSSSAKRTPKSSGGWGKKVIAALCVIFFLVLPLFGLSIALIHECDGGKNVYSGSAHSVGTAEALASLKNTKGKIYALSADIELSDEWAPVENFAGLLRGNGHVIRGLRITRFGEGAAGLFGTCMGAKFVDVILEDVSIESSFTAEGVGAIAGRAMDGCAFENCKVSGMVSAVTAKKVGGLAGEAGNISASGCEFSGTVSGMEDVGGLFGYLYDGASVKTCKTAGTVNGQKRTGGIAGQYTSEYAKPVTFTENRNEAAVDAQTEVAGGIAARVYSKSAPAKGKLLLGGNDNYGEIGSGHCAGGIYGEAEVGYSDTLFEIAGLYNGGDVHTSGNFAGSFIGRAKLNATLLSSEVQDGVRISAALYAGGAVGWFSSESEKTVQIAGLTIDAIVRGTACSGGIAGCSMNLLSCEFRGSAETTSALEGYTACGGITGRGYIVKNCTVAGRFVRSATGDFTGGIAGLMDEGGEIANCICGLSEGIFASGNNVGGITGGNNSGSKNTVIAGCTNRAPVSVSGDFSSVGGIVGQFNSGKSGNTYEISGCYNYGGVTAQTCSYVGGVIGYTYGSNSAWFQSEGTLSVVNLVCEADITGAHYVRGIIGYCSNIAGVERAVKAGDFRGVIVSSDNKTAAGYNELYCSS